MTLGELPTETMIAACRAAFENKHQATLILYLQDDIQVLCPQLHGTDANECPVRLVHLHHLFDWFPDLPWLSQIEEGEAAFKIDGEWVVEPWETSASGAQDQ